MCKIHKLTWNVLRIKPVLMQILNNDIYFLKSSFIEKNVFIYRKIKYWNQKKKIVCPSYR